jgi:hypothetical protein
MVVIHHSHRPHYLVVVLRGFRNELVAYKVANRFRPVAIPLMRNQSVELPQQVGWDGNAKTD